MNQFAFVIVLVCSIVPQGYGLKCYDCQSPNPGSNDCQNPKERTCEAGMDQCSITTSTMQVDMGGGTSMTVNSELRNCTMSAMCNEAAKQLMCQSMNITGGVTKCDLSCCQGDLCNTGVGPQPTLAPKPPAKNLSCYECSPEGMGQNGTGEALISCDAPRERKCGEFAPGMPYDRCMTVKMSVKNPKTGAILNQEMKNCSSNYMCQNNMVCQSGVNSTGDVVSCEATCCEGNLCNTDQLTTTPLGPTAGQTALIISNVLAIVSVVIALLFK